MRAFKAEKGSEFIAAHQPGPYSQQRFAENDRVFIAENVWRHALWMVPVERRSKLLLDVYKMSQL